MKKLFLNSFPNILFLIIATASLSGADDTLWHSEKALYRLTGEQTAPGEGFLDDRRICLPGEFQNGIEVYDEEGKKIEAHLYADGGVLLPAVEKSRKFYLYFGFPEDPEKEKTTPPAAKTSNKRLTLYQSQHPIPVMPKDLLGYVIRTNNEKINNFSRDNRTMKFVCDKPDQCRLKRRMSNRHPQAYLPFCARNVAFRKYLPDTPRGNLPLLSTPRAREFFCCGSITILPPDYKYLPLNHGACTENRIMNTLTRYKNIRETAAEKIKEAREWDPEDGLADTLLNHLRASSPRSLETGQVFLSKRPFDTGERFIVYYKGMLFAPESGKYRLRVRSNSTRILWIDGKAVIRTFGEMDATILEGTEDTVELDLEKGIHELVLCYHKENVPTFFFASWQKPSDDKLQTLSEEDFSPAYPVSVTSITSSKGEKYPLFLRDDKFDIFSSKLERVPVNTFVKADGGRDFKIIASSKTYSSTLNTVPIVDAGTVTLKADDKSFAPLTLGNYDRATPRISIHGDMSLKFWTPRYIFDDEKLNMMLEASSRLPFASGANLKFNFEHLNDKLPSLEKTIIFPGIAQEHENRFASDFLEKDSFPLEGPLLAKLIPLTGKAKIELPGFVFDSKEFKIVSASNIEKLSFDSGKLTDGNGTPLTILLHRPTLHEKRQWELPKTLAGTVMPKKKILALIPKFDAFSKALKEKLEARGIEIEYVFWPIESHYPTLEAMPEFYERLKKSSADAVIIIPNAVSARNLISMRDEIRTLAFAIELVRARSPKTAVLLATPFAESPSSNIAEESKKYSDALRALKRDYAVDFAELHAYLKKEDLEDKDFINPDKGGIKSLWPENSADKSAMFINSKL